MQDSVIFAVIIAGTTIIGLVGKLIYSSKCDVIKCCCCEIHRQVGQEMPVNIIENNNNHVTDPTP